MFGIFKKKLDYQLVIQINSSSIADFDAMMKLEDELRLELTGAAEVDGHDMGCGEINIFILTTNPIAIFNQIVPVLNKHKLLKEIRSAFRLVSEDDYTVIWPEHLTDEFSIA